MPDHRSKIEKNMHRSNGVETRRAIESTEVVEKSLEAEAETEALALDRLLRPRETQVRHISSRSQGARVGVLPVARVESGGGEDDEGGGRLE